MDLRKIKKLIELVKESGIAELEVGNADEKIRVAQFAPGPSGSADPAPPSEPSGDVAVELEKNTPGSVVAAPMAGTFYRSPAPGEAPFVHAGDTVAVGDVLCIIESMKMMNRVESDFAGQIAEVLVENGKPIESGAGLFRIL
ncbi:MAG: acetyl-CoA carboxylase biotin carboxyl carrier protein [Gammaproteobacteria bacterium]|nr:acetyl-CoA carboxylase biotin carboxyl carrier protein [Gammaproteobacteria bacterium]